MIKGKQKILSGVLAATIALSTNFSAVAAMPTSARLRVTDAGVNGDFYVANTGDESLDAMAVIARYDEDGTLLSVKHETVDVEAGKSQTAQMVMDEPFEKSDEVRGAVWNAKTCAPLCESASLSFHTDPYSRLEGEKCSRASVGAEVKLSDKCSEGAWIYLPTGGAWIRFDEVDFASGALCAAVIGSAEGSTRNAEIWIDGYDSAQGGTMITAVPIDAAAANTRLIENTPTGVHEVYVKSPSGAMYIDYIVLTQLGERGARWENFLSDTAWQNEIDINGVNSATYISNPDGGTLQLGATERPNSTSVTNSVTWSVDDESIATVTQSGLVRAKKAGEVTVSVSGFLSGIQKTGSEKIYIAPADAKFKDDLTNIAQEYSVPEWFRDAKLGVFVHWGNYSVAAHSSEWYSRDMYNSTSVRNWHASAFGSTFGYKDFLPSFTADKFDAHEWVELFKSAGAKYIIPVAEHHDGFLMYDSVESRWNAANVGPKRDVIGEIENAAREAELKFGVSNHFWENKWFYGKNAGTDAADSNYFDLYNTPGVSGKAQNDSTHMQNWFDRSAEIINRFNPDLIYYDWEITPTPTTTQLLAYYYNKAIQTNPDGVAVAVKFNFPENTTLFDVERGQLSDIRAIPWQTDTSISNASWGYIENDTYKNPADIIAALIDIVSKNGNLLLNVGPDKRGEIPKAAKKVFESIGAWLAINGESIYSTRVWDIFGEGPTAVESKNFSDDIQFTQRDFRFTKSKDDSVLYLSALKWPEGGKIKVSNLGAQCIDLETLKNITLLGGGEVEYSQSDDALEITLPSQSPNADGYPYVLKMAFEGSIPQYTPIPKNPYKRVEAEDFDDSYTTIHASHNAQIQSVANFSKGKNAGYIDNGAWVRYKNVDFKDFDLKDVKAYVRGAVTATGGTGCSIWLDAKSAAEGGTLLAKCIVPKSGSYNIPLVSVAANVNIPQGGLKGVHDIYITFDNGISMDWFIFKSAEYTAPTRDAYSRIDGEDFDDASERIIYELRSNFSNGADAGWCGSGDWLKYSSVDFAAAPKSVTAAYGSETATQLEVWLDGKSTQEGGSKLAVIALPASGAWDIQKTAVAQITSTVDGIHDVYINIGSVAFDYFEFSK